MFEMMIKIADLIGIIGVILLLIAYYFLNINKMTARCMNYQILNFVGAWFILFSLFFKWNTAAVTIEIAWIMISAIGIYRAWKNRPISLSKRIKENFSPSINTPFLDEKTQNTVA